MANTSKSRFVIRPYYRQSSYFDNFDLPESWTYKIPLSSNCFSAQVRHHFSPSCGIALDIFQFSFSFVAFCIFVYETYIWTHRPLWLLTFEAVFIFVGLCDFGLKLYLANDRTRFLQRPSALIDLTTTLASGVALVFYNSDERATVAVLQLMAGTRVFRLYRVLYFASTLMMRKALKLGYSIACLILYSATVWNAVIPELQYLNSLYFIVVTVATVGYGDVSPPSTVLSRMLLVVIILVAFVLIPVQTADLFKTVSQLNRYDGRFHAVFSRHRYVLVTCPGRLGVESLQTVLSQLLNRVQRLTIVLLLSHLPSAEMRALLDLPPFRRNIIYLCGSALSPFDLRRAAAYHAQAAFLIAPKTVRADHAERSDAEMLLHIISIRRASPAVPVYVQLLTPSSVGRAISAGATEVINVQEMKLSMLALACRYDGLTTLIGNLLTGFNSKAQSRWLSTGHPSWITEYGYGMSHECYRIAVPRAMIGRSFDEAARILYMLKEAALIGVESASITTFLLNPGAGYTLSHRDVLFVICHDTDVVSQIEKLTDANEIPVMQGGSARMTGVEFTMVTGSTPHIVENIVNGAELNDERVEVLRSIEQLDEEVSGHIVVAGFHESPFLTGDDVEPFAELLEHSGAEQPSMLVVLSPRKPPAAVRARLASLAERAVWIGGTPLDDSSLHRAGVQRASRVVVTAPMSSTKHALAATGIGGGDGADSDIEVPTALHQELVSDSWTISATLSLRRFQAKSIVELVHPTSIEYLQSTMAEDISDWRFSTEYASGRVCSSYCWDALLCHCWFSPHVLGVLRMLLAKEQPRVHSAAAGLRAKLLQISLPQEFVGATFGELSQTLVGRHCVVPLGLYRSMQVRGAPADYTFTLPWSTLVLHPSDRVFVITPSLG